MQANNENLKIAFSALKASQEKIEKLRNLKPYLIDASLRESSIGEVYGQTLADKLVILKKIREFGLKNIILGALNYSMPDESEVDDDFMIYLRDHQIDMTDCYALTAVGILNLKGQFVPDLSQQKLKDYAVPNTIHEIYLSDENMKGLYDRETILRSLPASIKWLNDNIRGASGEKPRIIINIVDGCDAVVQDSAFVFSVLELLSKQPIEGVSFQDSRGTFLPFQVGAFTAAARSLLPPPLKLLLHVHANAGVENASVLEALLNGADGVWGGLPKSGPVVGHASLGELISNLVRVGNKHMQDYRLDQLITLMDTLILPTDETPVHDSKKRNDEDPYRLPSSFFQQKKGRFMDLDPENVGAKYRYRVCSTVSDPVVIAERLAEITGQPVNAFSDSVLNQMIRLMRRDLREGKHVIYDDPVNLLQLYTRASQP